MWVGIGISMVGSFESDCIEFTQMIGLWYWEVGMVVHCILASY